MNGCGCRQCGGPDAAFRYLRARRIVLYQPFIRTRYQHEPAADLRNRRQPADLYSRLVMAAASREGM